MFPPSFFEHLEDRLNLAVYDTNEEYRMNIRLRDLALSRLKTPLPERPILAPLSSEKPKMSVTGLTSGAFQAKLAEMRQKIADRQAQALTKIDSAVASGGAKMDAAVDEVVAKADKEVDAALHEFATFTNGGPV